MKPTVLQRRDGIQLSYNVSHRIYDSRVYPLQSPNGSTVIVYGSQRGIRIIWYGGKPFKHTDTREAKVNGIAKADPMVIDLDEDEPESPDTGHQRAEFLDEDQEIDPSEPYDQVLQTLEIPLGTEALRIAVPHISSEASQGDSDFDLPIFRNNIIVAAACADFSIRLIVLPLIPPGPGTTEFSKAAVDIIKIDEYNSHSSLISSLAITFSADVHEFSDEDERSQNQAQNHGRFRDYSKANDESNLQAYILLASISCKGSGRLLIHQIPILDRQKLSSTAESRTPIRREYLPGPLSDAKLSFNPSSYPAERHSSLLLALPDMSCVKLYQVFPQNVYGKSRRGSTGTADSSSSIRSNPSLFTQKGKMLITLLPTFNKQINPNSETKRKRVLDAKWIIGGRAIITLLEDGQWGLWDLEAVGPSATSNLVRGQANISGIQGGAATKFALKRSITPVDLATKKMSKPAQTSSDGALAPMTPHTRKQKSDNLFKGENQDSPLKPHHRYRGEIHVSESEIAKSDESIVLSYGGTNVFIPSITSLWRSEIAGKSALDSSIGTQPQTLPKIHTGGEDLKGIAIISNPKSKENFHTHRSNPNLMACTESRLILLVTPLTNSSDQKSTDIIQSRFIRNPNRDQTLLDKGELDLDGMDRMIEGMTSTTNSKVIEPPAAPSDEDRDSSDIEMDSPSMSKPRFDPTRRPARSLFT